jgi:hypothetical protein
MRRKIASIRKKSNHLKKTKKSIYCPVKGIKKQTERSMMMKKVETYLKGNIWLLINQAAIVKTESGEALLDTRNLYSYDLKSGDLVEIENGGISLINGKIMTRALKEIKINNKFFRLAL